MDSIGVSDRPELMSLLVWCVGLERDGLLVALRFVPLKQFDPCKLGGMALSRHKKASKGVRRFTRPARVRMRGEPIPPQGET